MLDESRRLGRFVQRSRTNLLLAVFLAISLAAPLTSVIVAADDTTPPVGTLKVNGGSPVTNDPNNVRFDVPATDDLSGVAVVQLWVNGGGPLVIDYAPSFVIPLPWWNQGPNSIEVRWQDVTGNLSDAKSATLTIDLTPPSGTVKMYDYDAAGVTFDVVASTASDVAGVVFACEDQAVPAVRAYATRITVPYGPGGLDCGGAFGEVTFHVGLKDAAGNVSLSDVQIFRDPTLTLTTSASAATGHPFTITPNQPGDYLLPSNGGCRWEFRWGDDASLDDQNFNETFGSLLFDIPARSGRCQPWTFTLPWVPVRQYEINVSLYIRQSDGGMLLFGGVRQRFNASVDSTERRITSSSLPIAQVLPSTYTPIVGSPVTYTRYLIGGASGSGNPVWVAHLGTGEDPIVWEKWTTSSTFTITPPKPGRLLVQWYREQSSLLLGAMYDPPVRYKDTTDPNTTAPIQRFASGGAGPTVPVSITWSGTDKGWGIKGYRLERSVNGGAWTKVTLPSITTKTIIQQLTNGKSYRFRVRATDKAGNVGSWDYGPTFKPRRVSDGNTAVRYSSGWKTVADPTAFGAVVHEATAEGRAVRFTFTGRDIAWLAERGPGFGKAKVYVDGVYIKTVDTGHDLNLPRRLVFRKHWSYVGTHTIRIVVSGTSGRPTISLDGFAILR
ncbi:MAG: fibronectin type III domain-containing protein [Chloroflexota bacterium]